MINKYKTKWNIFIKKTTLTNNKTSLKKKKINILKIIINLKKNEIKSLLS